MMESKHTPGPWDADNGIIWAGRIEIAVVGDEEREASERDNANAALIAAAPDMYDVLVALRDAKRNSTQDLRHVADRLLDDVIAKAEGR